MSAESTRKHGVTPGLSQRYAMRTAESHAAFVIPYLDTGMSLLDVGCGPGSITLGLAEAVAPGVVVGIDHDPGHVETARALAADRGVENVSFEVANVYELPFDDDTFDVAFEHAVFIHLRDPAASARSIFRVLKPGGLLAARDTEMDGHLIGNPDPLLEQGYEIFYQWHRHRGSNLKLGKHLRSILSEAGFKDIVGSASYDPEGAEQDSVREHGTTMAGLFRGTLAEVALEQGWADTQTLDAIAEKWLEWREHPGSFMANAMCEAVGWKPAIGSSD